MSKWLAVRAELDRFLAAVLSLVAAPLVVVFAVAKRLEDGGRAFVRIPRIGQYGQAFAVVKIRSMRDTVGGLAGGSSLTAGADVRITALGGLLRRWRLDELPQLGQVVAGTMALLGPRPEAPGFVDLDDPDWQAVLAARPAIAGPTQLLVEALEAQLPAADPEGFYRTDLLPLKVRVDRWYVENASPLVDVVVVVGLLQRFVLRRPPTVLMRYVMVRNPGIEAHLAAAGEHLRGVAS